VAIRRVVAAIDVVINGQRNLDRLAQGYLALERTVIRAQTALTRTTTSTTAMGRAFNTMTSGIRGATSAFGSMVTTVERGRTALDQQGRTTRGLTDNILSLTKSMLLFSVLLPAVQMPQRIIESFGDFIKVGAEWQTQMRAANALLDLNEKAFKDYNVQVQQMAIAQGVATDQMEMFVTAASSVAGIKQNTQAMQAMGKEAYNASVALELATESARLARATNTQAAESQSTLIEVMSAYRFGLEETTKVADSLFAITDVGNVRFRELESTIPRITAAMGPFIQNAQTAADKQRVMNESFAAFAAMTQVMPADMAATSFANIFKDISQMTGQQRSLVQTWEKIRVQQGLGRDMSLDPTALIENGPMAGLIQLRKVLDLQSPLVTAYVQNQKRLGNTADEGSLRMTGQMQIAQAYFEDMRAVRGFVSTTPELLEASGQAFGESRQGGVERGIGQMEKTLTDAQKRLGAAWTAIRTAIFQPLEAPMIAHMNPIIEMFSNMLTNVDFQNGSVLNKIRMVANALMDSFTNYFRSGGRGEIQSVGREIGTFIGDSITAFFRGGKDNVLVEAATAFGEAFVSGIGQTLPDMLKAIITSSLTRALAEGLAISYVTKGRIPDVARRALAVGVPALTLAASDNGGGVGTPNGTGMDLSSLALPAAATLVTGVAATAAFRRFGGAPIFGAGLNSRFGPNSIRSLADVGAWLSLVSPMRMGAARARGPIPTPPTGSVLGSLGKAIGPGALLTAAQVLPELLSDESEREKWAAIGGGVGGVGGGLLGVVGGGGIGSLALGLAGSIGGGMFGRWAGGALYDRFHPATGAGGMPAGGADTMDAPERVAVADIFATGMDNSSLPTLLTQIRDILIRSGGGAVGGFSSPTATTGTTKTSANASSGNLANNFVNQMDRTQLTYDQTQAACGPAAAAFFAQAYGRNPTLKEAYALITQIQGADPAAAGVGGTRGVATIGQALNKMGVGNEVYTGANVDWGRLANNAQAGIPGIVNIGPSGRFPGHFFQIGGWDPSTNRFNVGTSGTVLSKFGGKDWMTPQEMMALGPTMGAVYGTGTGAGPGVTAADVASIQGAGTGTGPGEGGGGITINVQNLMNVERMDGNTDIRALMGQMADMLRQLSTGGSVVGQNGTVAP